MKQIHSVWRRIGLYAAALTGAEYRSALDGVADSLSQFDEQSDTVQDQISIARQKAGIKDGEPIKLQRFEVVRHF